MYEELIARLQTLPGATSFESRAGSLWMDAPGLDVTAAAQLILEYGARLSTITGLVVKGGETEVIYHYALGAQACNLRVLTHGNRLPSITPVLPAANWPEREIADLYAVTFTGHPDPARLVRPPQLQPGYFREPGGAAGKALREQK